jgi:hypothetical protein
MITKEKKLEGFALRLNQALDDHGVPAKGEGRQLWLAKYFKMNQISARGWLEGISYPKHEHLIDLCELLKINVQWLLLGKGSKEMGLSIDSKAYERILKEKSRLETKVEVNIDKIKHYLSSIHKALDEIEIETKNKFHHEEA